MSLLKANSVQIGQSATAGNNFVWYQPAIPDGTIRLANGNSGSATDVITINSSGDVTFTGNVTGAGIVASDDTTTNASYYPSLFTTTNGQQTIGKVSSTKLYFNPSTGTLNATSFNSLSDATQKTDVARIGGPAANLALKQLNGVEFRWKDTDKKSAGVIAQELEKVLPFLVDTNENGIKSVNYSGLIAYLIESNKELIARIEALENK